MTTTSTSQGREVPPVPREAPADFIAVYSADSAVSRAAARAMTKVAVTVGAFVLLVALAARLVDWLPAGIELVAGAAGILFAALASRSWIRTLATIQRRRLAFQEGDVAVATVTDCSQLVDPDGSVRESVFHFEFQLGERTIRGEHHIEGPAALNTGDAVEVLYRPADPVAAVIYDPRGYSGGKP